jgi:hypothetical protein
MQALDEGDNPARRAAELAGRLKEAMQKRPSPSSTGD